MNVSPAAKTTEFLKIAQEFKLGHLQTESFHPKTASLSQLVKGDVESALRLLQEVDADAIAMMEDRTPVLWALAQEIRSTLSAGHKVFLCGCGATGRLSLVLETLYRQKFGPTDQVVSFMAGGDYALIKSVESFEDKTEYGERQLLELGFGPHDLLLASTEGGETPFVIGAALKAAETSRRKPFFLYCNPDELLLPIKRSREVLQHRSIQSVNLSVGPMAVSGSTRMQASTVLMLGIGVGLLYVHQDRTSFDSFYRDLLRRLRETDYTALAPFTTQEARCYQEGRFVNYVTSSALAISILTDTTERSPTFSLRGFENRLDQQGTHALAYLFIPDAASSSDAWTELLQRPPRAIDWAELGGRINLERLLGFDISRQGLSHRSTSVSAEEFSVVHDRGSVSLAFGDAQMSFRWGDDPLFNHLMIKMLLNAHSTLIMGLLGRYEGNVMTWVRPSNNKLIDRAARYALQVLHRQGKESSYEAVVGKIFEEIESLNENEPVVMKVVARF